MASTTAATSVSRTIQNAFGYGILKEGLSAVEVKALKKACTVVPQNDAAARMLGFKPNTEGICFLSESKTRYYAPKHIGRELLKSPLEIAYPPSPFPYEPPPGAWDFVGELRPIQEDMLSAYIASAHAGNDGVLSVPCGYGKTATALAIAAHMHRGDADGAAFPLVTSRPVLVIVNEEDLGEQWRERVAQFLPGARVGWIQRDKCEVIGKDIVVGMLQSLCKNTGYDRKLLSSFGLIIVDECHVIGSEVYTQALLNMSAPCMMGLSATPRRADGLTSVMHMFLGPIAYTKEADADPGVQVRPMWFLEEDEAYNDIKMNNLGTMDTAGMISRIAEWPARNALIIKTAMGILAEDPARQLLILSDRREGQLEILHGMFLEAGLAPEDVGFYVGRQGVSKKVHRSRIEASVEGRVILGTFAKAKQGIDIPTLNALILATPHRDVQQATGRILREPPHKRRLAPIIVDVIDAAFKRQFTERKKYYKAQGYSILGC